MLYDRQGNELTIATDSLPFVNKKFAFLGDSFTSPNIWTVAMCEKLGATNLINVAIGGARWSYENESAESYAYNQAQRIVNENYNPDVIMCCLGCNDGGNNVTLGEVVLSNSIGDFDLSTFTGGMQACINYLQNNFPEAEILIGWTPAGGNCNWSTSDVVEPFIDRMKEVCLIYGVKYLETRTCGITKYSDAYADCWESGTGGGHPTSVGHTKIGESMARIVSSTV